MDEKIARKVGVKHLKAYNSWSHMRRRCLDPKNPQYKDYGGRGIKICARWRDDFWAFFRDMGERVSGLSLDRIDNNGHYEPGNCRWATPAMQNRNKRRSGKTPIYGEGNTLVRHGISISQRHREYCQSRGVGVSAFIRQLIDAHMQSGEDPCSSDPDSGSSSSD